MHCAPEDSDGGTVLRDLDGDSVTCDHTHDPQAVRDNREANVNASSESHSIPTFSRFLTTFRPLDSNFNTVDCVAPNSSLCLFMSLDPSHCPPVGHLSVFSLAEKTFFYYLRNSVEGLRWLGGFCVVADISTTGFICCLISEHYRVTGC